MWHRSNVNLTISDNVSIYGCFAVFARNFSPRLHKKISHHSALRYTSKVRTPIVDREWTR